jgi:hypothetical protein
MRKTTFIIGTALVCLVAAAMYPGFGSRSAPTVVLASSGGSFDPSVALEDNGSGSGGGMAQYAAAEQTSTSLTDTQQAVANWNNYIGGRANWYFSSGDVTTIADADWNARQAGSPTITASQIASAASQVINNTLSTMSVSQQQSMFDQYAYVMTAQGKFGTDWADPNVSAAQNSNGTWSVSVSPNEFSSLKSFFQQYAPGMMSPGSNFYPGEAMIVFYAAATCDRGYGGTFVTGMASLYDETTGLASGSYPFGDSGYVCRRPLQDFLTEPNLSQVFSDLGF